jgi:hypothetical protein
MSEVQNEQGITRGTAAFHGTTLWLNAAGQWGYWMISDTED